MHDSLRVRIRERARDVSQDVCGFPTGERPAAEPSAQRLAAHERHGVVGQAAGCDARREERNDVRLLERGREPDLAREAIGRQSLEQVGTHHLDDNLPAQRRLRRDENAAHPAAAEFAVEKIGVPEGRL